MNIDEREKRLVEVFDLLLDFIRERRKRELDATKYGDNLDWINEEERFDILAVIFEREKVAAVREFLKYNPSFELLGLSKQ